MIQIHMIGKLKMEAYCNVLVSVRDRNKIVASIITQENFHNYFVELMALFEN